MTGRMAAPRPRRQGTPRKRKKKRAAIRDIIHVLPGADLGRMLAIGAEVVAREAGMSQRHLINFLCGRRGIGSVEYAALKAALDRREWRRIAVRRDGSQGGAA